MTQGDRSVVRELARTAALAGLLLTPSFIVLHALPAFAQEEPDAHDDVSTENSAALGQMKEQKIIQDQRQSDRDDSEKKETTKRQDRPAGAEHSDARPERTQRFERPMRPERPHR